MTLSTIKPCTLFMFICLVLLLISTWEVEAKIFCGRPSRTWSGPCIDTECDRECIDSERRDMKIYHDFVEFVGEYSTF
ncbi:uncharacterized protein LOC131616353 isoform X3 [Vicia villosa]|uniref:uncharacterized protein LOC131616353 isoform X3 n=1 Tax=Vicia villosa TaxID=3911 RepID=UPI00273C627E|nr:uncharacterized protein LOC131616353 isoform X3 [Vicia villosa]